MFEPVIYGLRLIWSYMMLVIACKEAERSQTGSNPANNGPQKPPPPQIPVLFPKCVPQSKPDQKLNRASNRRVYDLFASIRKPTDINLEHIQSLNIHVQHDVPFEQLIPFHTTRGGSFLPPASWDDPSVEPKDRTDMPKVMLCTGAEAPGSSLYQQRKEEITGNNEDSFRAVLREQPRQGRPSIRLKHYYKFWQGLQMMAQHWDSPDDERVLEGDTITDTAKTEQKTDGERSYDGRRIGNGKDMPESYRENAVKSFIEPIAWLFGCTFKFVLSFPICTTILIRQSSPSIPPRLSLQTILFPVRLTLSGSRASPDSQKARRGYVQGPIFGVQCRPEIFTPPEDAQTNSEAATIDQLRELGALLLLAQERGREGKAPTKPGEGKWYTTKPRWGGGIGGVIGENGMARGTNSDDVARETPKSDARRIKRSRKGSGVDGYKRLDPGMGMWDPKVEYVALGREKGDDGDDVFLISSLYHHIAILRLHIPNAASYMHFLETGTFLSSPSASSTLSTDPPILHRSRWFDLFDAADRVEAMRGLWGMCAYMMRERSGDEDGKERWMRETPKEGDVVMRH
ncbi:MAG: hypothetical protein M1817_000643 [Caeruleum heppii]|nr:MAG: hypothetical protein M1817_000643 [Caeruleum heppii]